MFPGPVFVNELRLAARRIRSYAARFAVGLLLLYIVVIGYADTQRFGGAPGRTVELSPAESARLGGQLFTAVLWLQGAVVLLLTPASFAGSIAEDRQRRILDLFLASPLSVPEIVVGKLAPRLIHLSVLVLVGLPVVSISLLFGGVDPQDVWFAYAVTFSTLYFLAGISVVQSVFCERPRDAVLRAYAVGLGWLLLPAFEEIILNLGGGAASLVREARPVTEWITAASPLAALFPQRNVASWPWAEGLRVVGLQLLYGSLFLVYAMARLRPLERGSGLLNSWSRFRGGGRRITRRRGCGDSPMIWKECTGALTLRNPVMAAGSAVLGVAVVVGLIYWIAELVVPAAEEIAQYGYGLTGPSVARDRLNLSVRILSTILYLFAALTIAGIAATGVTNERERDTWTSLVSTPLEAREIIQGKFLGAFFRIRIVLGLMVLIWSIGATVGAVHPFGLLLAALATTIFLSFIVTLGTFVSLRSRSSTRAILSVVAVLIFLNGGYLLCCVPVPGTIRGTLGVTGITPFVMALAPFSFHDFDSFLRGTSLLHARNDLIFNFVGSLLSYALGGWAMYGVCLRRFDIEVDRPRRDELTMAPRILDESDEDDESVTS
jgi:ABC-type Na+ efflux pump permease subunit